MAKNVKQFSRFVRRMGNKARVISSLSDARKPSLVTRKITVPMAITTPNGAPILPYDRHRVFDEIMKHPLINYKLENHKLLIKVLKVAKGFIGAHESDLYNWMMLTNGAKDEMDQPFDWAICAGSCSEIGVGNCNSWCVGGSCRCETVTEPNDPNQDTGSGTKHYKLILTIWL